MSTHFGADAIKRNESQRASAKALCAYVPDWLQSREEAQLVEFFVFVEARASAADRRKIANYQLRPEIDPQLVEAARAKVEREKAETAAEKAHERDEAKHAREQATAARAADKETKRRALFEELRSEFDPDEPARSRKHRPATGMLRRTGKAPS